ncbi:substrate-binding domain-containing protein [Nonomuraea ferruginea]
MIKKGIHSAVDPSGFKLLAEYDTPEWSPEKAQTWVSGQITQFGDDIVGVVAANDGTASGTIAAFKAAGKDVPPVTGNDAEIAAAQRIIKGDQYNTISKPIKIVAEAAADVAYKFMQGQKPEGKDSLYDTPSELFVPTVVTKENVKEVLFDSGIMKASEVCTGEYAEGCAALDIK